MPESTYKIIELVGTSESSWEDAAKNALSSASKSLKEMRIGEVTRMDMKIENGQPRLYRTRLQVSFKYMKED